MAVAGASQTQNGMIMAWTNVVWALDGCTTRRPAAKNGVRHGGVARAMRRGGAAKRPLPKAECVSRQLALGVAGRKNSIEGFLVLIIAYRRGTCLVLSCVVLDAGGWTTSLSDYTRISLRPFPPILSQWVDCCRQAVRSPHLCALVLTHLRVAEMTSC